MLGRGSSGSLAMCASTMLALVTLAVRSGSAQETAPDTSPVSGHEGLYDSVGKLAGDGAPCVVLVDLTDPANLPAVLAKPGGLWALRRLEARLTALSGLDCRCFNYTQLKRDTLQVPSVKAIVLRPPSPAGLLKNEAAKQELWAMLRESTIPTIGFCGGFHQAYLAYGGTCADMRKLAPDEPDPNPRYAPGRLKEWGFCKVSVVRRDPLFDGLGSEIEMLQQHVSECTDLPPDFELLASSDVCRVQAIRHKTRPLYATQFHPEAYEEGHMDGRRLLLNFFRIAGVNGPLSR